MSAPQVYEVAVGDLWVSVDFEARAVSVSRILTEIPRSPLVTEDLGNGFLIDRQEGKVVHVEVIGAQSESGDAA